MLNNFHISPNLLKNITRKRNWITNCRYCKTNAVDMSLCNVIYIYEVVSTNSIGYIHVHDNCLKRELLREKLSIDIGGIGQDLFFGTIENAIKYVKKLMVIL